MEVKEAATPRGGKGGRDNGKKGAPKKEVPKPKKALTAEEVRLRVSGGSGYEWTNQLTSKRING